MSNIYSGTGRRKKSIAKVRLFPGNGKITINKRNIDDYFGLGPLKIAIKQPFVLIESEAKFDVVCSVKGGGLTGQAGAIRLGISRALLKSDETLRIVLKKAGFLTRDSRE